jgi:hypothetical protein
MVAGEITREEYARTPAKSAEIVKDSMGRDHWRNWAKRCLAAMEGKTDLPDPENARLAFEEIVRLGVEPYVSLKGYAVLNLDMDDGEP